MNINKYDRQIRIWGSKGQKRLVQSKIAIIGCQGVSIQAAKNIILPGVGQIDIFDTKKLQQKDLSNSFFFDYESIGKLKGEVACKNLIQMNSDVKGNFYNKSVQQIIQLEDQILKNYNLVICGNLLQDQNKILSLKFWNLKIPVIFATIVGFFFHIRSQKQIHTVEFQNTSSKKYYLRLHEPFKALEQYSSSKRLLKLIEQLKNTQKDQQIQSISSELDKIVYPIYLIQAYKINKSLNKLSVNDIKNLLIQWKNLINQSYRDSINEAIRRSFDLYQTPDNFLLNINIFQQQQIVNVKQGDHFMLLFLKAVKQFLRLNKHLPQPISLPDMNGTSKDYLQFKNILKIEHQKNKIQIKEIIHSLFPKYKVDDILLSEYINNIQILQIIKMRPYFQQLDNPDVLNSSLNYLQEQKSLYVCLRAYKIYENQYKKVPFPKDYHRIQQIADGICKLWGLDNINTDYLKQICRYEGQTMISYNSMAGAIVGQECIKLLSNCFTPMNNGYIFEGTNCKGYSLSL